MIVQTVEFPVITTMTRTERTVAQVIAIVSGTDRMDIFYVVDGPPRKEKKKSHQRKCVKINKWIGPLTTIFGPLGFFA